MSNVTIPYDIIDLVLKNVVFHKNPKLPTLAPTFSIGMDNIAEVASEIRSMLDEYANNKKEATEC